MQPFVLVATAVKVASQKYLSLSNAPNKNNQIEWRSLRLRRSLTIRSAITRGNSLYLRNFFIRHNSPRIQALTELAPTQKNKNYTINKKNT